MTRPVRELARGVEAMKRQGKSQQLRVYSSDELGQLTMSFNEMANLLTHQQENWELQPGNWKKPMFRRSRF